MPREFQLDLQQWVEEHEQIPETWVSRRPVPNADIEYELHIFCDALSTVTAATMYYKSSSAEKNNPICS